MNTFLRNTIYTSYTTLYQRLRQQHEMHLRKGCRAYVILLLYCITGWWRTWDMGRRDWKTSRKKKQKKRKATAKTSSGQGRRKRGQGATVRTSSSQRTTRDDERYDTVAKIKLVYEGKRKKLRVTGNLNNSHKKIIMANITAHIEMRVKVIYSFKSVTYRGAREIEPYSKTLDSSPAMFKSLKEIQAFIKECE